MRISAILVAVLVLDPEPAAAQSTEAAPSQACLAATASYDAALADVRGKLKGKSKRKTTLDAGQPATVTPDARSTEGWKAIAEARRKHGTSSMALADALFEQSIVLQQAARFPEALSVLDEADAILARKAPRSAKQARAFRQRGIILSNMRRREEAIVALDAAIALYKEGPARSDAMEALNHRTKADVLRGLNRYTEALAAIERAEAHYVRRGKKGTRDLAALLIEKSIILSRLGDLKRQREVAGAAADLAEEKLGLANRITAQARHNLAIAERRAGRHVEALSHLAAALAIHEALGTVVASAEAVEEAGKTLNWMGCFNQSIILQTRALDIYRNHYGASHVRIADGTHRLGAFLREMGRNDMALARFTEAISMFDDLLGPGNVRSAVVVRETAELLLKQGKPAEALDLALRSVHNLERTTAPDETRASLLVLAKVLQASGNTEAAILFAKRAVNRQQELRAANRELPPELSAAFAERYRSLYLYLAELLIDSGRMDEAQHVLDLIKSQEVMDFVRGGRPTLTAFDKRASLTSTERAALGKLDDLLKQPIATSKELEALLAKARTKTLDDTEKARVAELKRAFADNYKAFQNDVKSLLAGLDRQSAKVQGEVAALHLDMLGQARKKLKQFNGRAALLQIASLEDAVHIFVTTPNAQSHRSVKISRTELARLAFDGWSLTANASPEAGPVLAELYDVLIRPVEGDLKASGADVIMLNLEGFLRYIPFAALKNGERHLIEDYALAIQTPAAETVYAESERDRSRAVGFGVTDAHGEFSPLPAVARELESLFDGTDASGVFAGSPLLNKDFDETRFASALEQTPLYVHIASHFKLEPGDESRSFLLLGNGGTLSLEAIRTDARFQFSDVDLLTLSACQTAGEVGSDGKEVESFATLAQGSGASSVMATLWPIADESTALLMGDFYRGLLDDMLDKATALRRAQVAMLRGVEASTLDFTRRGMTDPDGSAASPEQAVTTRHPYYWSPFIIMGNWL